MDSVFGQPSGDGVGECYPRSFSESPMTLEFGFAMRVVLLGCLEVVSASAFSNRRFAADGDLDPVGGARR